MQVHFLYNNFTVDTFPDDSVTHKFSLLIGQFVAWLIW